MTGRVVRDESGDRYLLEKRSAESSRVRDPETGERLHLPNEQLEPVADASPLAVAAGGLSDPGVALVTGVPSERARPPGVITAASGGSRLVLVRTAPSLGGVTPAGRPGPVVDGHGPSSAAALVALAVGGDPAVVVSFPPAGPSRFSIRVSS